MEEICLTIGKVRKLLNFRSGKLCIHEFSFMKVIKFSQSLCYKRSISVSTFSRKKSAPVAMQWLQ